MGQASNSGRNASLDEKKQRAAGREQNEPSNEAITDRQEHPPVAGAFGREGEPNRRGDNDGGNFVTGDTSGSSGGAATENLDVDARPPASNP